MDAVGQEVATFNIGVTIVEPGGALEGAEVWFRNMELRPLSKK